MNSPEYIRWKVRYPSGADVDRRMTVNVTTIRPTTASGVPGMWRLRPLNPRRVEFDRAVLAALVFRHCSVVPDHDTAQLAGDTPAPQRAPRLRSARSPHDAE